MSEEQPGRRRVRRHTVRPRWVWIALVLLVIGVVLIGAGIIVESWRWAVPGIVLLGIGGCLGLYGGLFYDVQGGVPRDVVSDLVDGNEREFPGAGTMRHEAEVKRDVRRRWLRGRRGGSRAGRPRP